MKDQICIVAGALCNLDNFVASTSSNYGRGFTATFLGLFALLKSHRELVQETEKRHQLMNQADGMSTKFHVNVLI